MVNVALVEARGFRTFWSSRTDGEIESVLLRELEKIVPYRYGLWKHIRKRSAQWIAWRGGHVTDLVSRNVDNPKKRPALGFNVMGGWHDEAATGFLESKFDDIENAVREPGAPFLFVSSYSTPLENEYEEYVYKSGAKIVFSSSWDNPHLSRSMLDERAARMDRATMERELGGKFQKATGLMWPDFEFDIWPNGNLVTDFEYNPDEPFYVGIDLGGSQSAYKLIQYIEPLHPISGERMFYGKLAVCFAEYVPNQIGLPAICADIQDKYGAPAECYVGHDVNATTVIGDQASLVFTQLGWKFSRPSGPFFRKDVQQMALRMMLLNVKGERRFAVAVKKGDRDNWIINEQYHGDGKTRGVLSMFKRDVYPDAKSNELFQKDKATKGKNAIEDDRDSLMHWCVCAHPPKWVTTEQRAVS